jgi:hypothetical protein
MFSVAIYVENQYLVAVAIACDNQTYKG